MGGTTGSVVQIAHLRSFRISYLAGMYCFGISQKPGSGRALRCKYVCCNGQLRLCAYFSVDTWSCLGIVYTPVFCFKSDCRCQLVAFELWFRGRSRSIPRSWWYTNVSPVATFLCVSNGQRS